MFLDPGHGPFVGTFPFVRRGLLAGNLFGFRVLNRPVVPRAFYFAYPGELETQTGGYHYDRRIISELREIGADVKTLALPDSTSLLEKKSHQIVRQMFAELPDRSILIMIPLSFWNSSVSLLKEKRSGLFPFGTSLTSGLYSETAFFKA